MKRTYIECDICRREIIPSFHALYRHEVKAFRLENNKFFRKIDVCDSCFGKFIEYVRTSKEQK